jgi:hypothetical protein
MQELSFNLMEALQKSAKSKSSGKFLYSETNNYSSSSNRINRRLAVESFLADSSSNKFNLQRLKGFHRKTLTVLTEEELKQKDEYVTPKNNRILFRPDNYYFTNSFQNSVNKAEFNFTTNKKIEMVLMGDKSASHSTHRRAEEYLDCKNNSMVKIDFENIEIEKVKQRWNECVITNDNFTIEGEKENSICWIIFLINLLLVLICMFMYFKYVWSSYVEKIDVIPITRYELVYHNNMKDFINN